MLEYTIRIVFLLFQSWQMKHSMDSDGPEIKQIFLKIKQKKKIQKT